MLATILCLTTAFGPDAQILPAGKGKAEFERICSGCHSVTIVTRQRMTSLRWLGVVSDMASRGAQGSAENFQNIVTYLGTNFGEGGTICASREISGPSIGEQRMIPGGGGSESSIF
jgi:hypothetical protein